MGRCPRLSDKGEELKRGAWTDQEDKLLTCYIMAHGEGKWTHVPKAAGLNRSGKSCRLRWLNYPRPDIKRGNISRDEEDLIIRLHKLLGNRIPGRTDNERKNYWNTTLSRKRRTQSCVMATDSHPSNKSTARKPYDTSPPVIQTKPWKCKNVVIRHPPCPKENLLLSNQKEFREADLLTTQFINQSQNSPPLESRVNNVHEHHQLNQNHNFDMKSLSLGNNNALCMDFNGEGSEAMDAHNEQCQPTDQVMFNGWTMNCFDVDINSIGSWC